MMPKHLALMLRALVRLKRPSASSFPALLVLFAALSPAALAQRLMTPEDTLRVGSVGDAQISPDGEWVAYTVSTTEGDVTRSTLWLVRARANPATGRTIEDGLAYTRTPPVQLLAPGWNASAPRWSPDGRRLAFFARQQERSGIWVVSLADRQPRFLVPVAETNFYLPYAGESFAWSPDSRRIAFISATEEPAAAQPDAARPLARGGTDDPRIVDRIQYKSRTSFSDRRRTHLWMVEVDSSSAAEGAPRQLTSGQYYDHALAWSPRGDEIAFLSNHEAEPEATNNSDIFAVDLNGRTRQLTQTRGCEYEPAWSPDGKWLAYTATKREVTTIDSVAEDAHVWIIEAGGGQGRELSGAHDRRARSPRWLSDNRTILFLAGDMGRTLIYRVGIEREQVRPVSLLYFGGPNQRDGFFVTDGAATDNKAMGPPRRARPFQINSFSIASRSAVRVRQGVDSSIAYASPLAFTLSDALHPAEIWYAFGPSAPVRRLSAHNDALLDSLSLVEPEDLSFKSFDGTTVQGWLLKPAGWREDRSYPLILSIHGGPHGMFGYGFNSTFQVYAARGYAVLYLNPRGSSGYGQKFSDGTLREWGGGDYRDLMAGLDEALRTRSWIDPDRLGVTGGSYGGFMTNWIITQTTRFRAAVASASVSNLISFYATSLYQDLIHAEFGGFPWDDYDLLWRWSPLRYVRQAQTPTLLLHGEQDNDVHITQAEEMYMALRRRGIETVLVRYPREGHGLREPRHRLDALERTLGWFDRFLK